MNKWFITRFLIYFSIILNLIHLNNTFFYNYATPSKTHPNQPTRIYEQLHDIYWYWKLHRIRSCLVIALHEINCQQNTTLMQIHSYENQQVCIRHPLTPLIGRSFFPSPLYIGGDLSWNKIVFKIRHLFWEIQTSRVNKRLHFSFKC